MYYLRVLLCFLIASWIPCPEPARADSLLNDLMPSVFGPRDRGPKPEETLIAPFAQDGPTPRQITPEQGQALAKSENLAPVTVPHQSRDYMTKWAADQVAMMMTYNPMDQAPNATEGPASQQVEYKKALLPTAQTEIETLWAQPFFAERLNSRGLRVKGFVQNPATIENEGLFGDTYRWLIDVPVTITFFPQGSTMSKAERSKNYETKTLIIRLQITRVAGGYPDGCAIERFTNMTTLP